MVGNAGVQLCLLRGVLRLKDASNARTCQELVTTLLDDTNRKSKHLELGDALCRRLDESVVVRLRLLELRIEGLGLLEDHTFVVGMDRERTNMRDKSDLWNSSKGLPLLI